MRGRFSAPPFWSDSTRRMDGGLGLESLIILKHPPYPPLTCFRIPAMPTFAATSIDLVGTDVILTPPSPNTVYHTQNSVLQDFLSNFYQFGAENATI